MRATICRMRHFRSPHFTHHPELLKLLSQTTGMASNDWVDSLDLLFSLIPPRTDILRKESYSEAVTKPHVLGTNNIPSQVKNMSRNYGFCGFGRCRIVPVLNNVVQVGFV